MPIANELPQDAFQTGKASGARPIGRRQLLAGGALFAAGAAMGSGYRPAASLLQRLSSSGLTTAAIRPQAASPQPGFRERAEQAFNDEARRIHEAHRRQTAEMVSALKRKYEQPVFGRMRVWDLIEKLGQCTDATDYRLCGASQLLHAQQAVAAMELHGVTDPDLFLIALIHDLGKLFLLAGEVPENVCCPSGRIGEYPSGVGLDQVLYQFGHAELIYSRIRGLVPEHVAWTVRYHNIDRADAEEFMDDRDREFAAKYLEPFRTFDRDFKSIHWTPAFDARKYRDLVERYFPNPILF